MKLYCNRKIKINSVFTKILFDLKHGKLICNGRPWQNIHYNTCSQSTLSVQALFTHYI
jgi:hypothetical protein